MRPDRRSESSCSWWLSGSAAFFVHCAVVFALPDTPAGCPASAQPTAELVWLSATWQDSAVGARDDSTQGTGELEHPSDTRAMQASTPPRSGRSHGTGPRGTTAGAREAKRVSARPAPEATLAARAVRAAPSAPSAISTPQFVASGGLDSGLAAAQGAGAEVVSNAGVGEAEGEGHAEVAGVGGGTGSAFAAGTGGGSARKPCLLAVPNPCRGYFPANAPTDHAKVRVAVHVDATGHARAKQLLVESPEGQGFGRAARACAAALRFAPALDSHGVAVAGEAKLELRFDRS